MRPDYMVLINEDNRLPDGFENTVELIGVENAVGEKYTVEKKTYEAFLRLRQDLMENDGIQPELLSVYRTVAQQTQTFERYLAKYGEKYTRTYVALPGCSEHHTGFAIDVGIFADGTVNHANDYLFSIDEIYKVMHKKLPKYGFILRYPKGKEAGTKIGYEPWHFRYIDDPVIAQEITDKGICFEEYKAMDN